LQCVSSEVIPDPYWKSTQTGNTSKNSKILRENLGLQKGDGNEAHHIVPSTSKMQSDDSYLQCGLMMLSDFFDKSKFKELNQSCGRRVL